MTYPFSEAQWPVAEPLATGPRLAGLQMYDMPELFEANDRLWAAIAERLTAAGEPAPERLTRDRAPEETWDDPQLLLAQTCGYPFMTRLRRRAALVATPRYRAEGCEGPFHSSAIVVRKGHKAMSLADMRDTRLALNSPASGSGMNLLRAAVARHAQRRPFFAGVSITGSHIASVEAVAYRAADIAAIDAVTWAHLGWFRGDLTRSLRVLAWTGRSPGLPLITSRTSDARLRALLVQTLQDVSRDPALAQTLRTLRIEGFNALPESHYSAVLADEAYAVELGYPVLA